MHMHAPTSILSNPQKYTCAHICAHEKYYMVVHEVVNIDKLHDSMNESIK